MFILNNIFVYSATLIFYKMGIFMPLAAESMDFNRSLTGVTSVKRAFVYMALGVSRRWAESQSRDFGGTIFTTEAVGAR